MEHSDNPLLHDVDALPSFRHIRPGHVVPAMDQLLAANRNALAVLLAGPGPFSWDNLVAPLEENEDHLNRAWSPVDHLHAVADSDALRTAYHACLPKLTDYATEMGQNEPLYRAYRGIAEGPDYARLTRAQRKVIDNALRDFRLSGVELAPDARERFRSVQQRLSELENRFEENLLDATDGWFRHVTDPALLRGLPDSALALAAETARRKDKPGWVLTLEIPSYLPVMEYAENRELRREMYEAYATRASDQGPCAGRWDNGGVMVEILALRRELAALLGYPSYAHLSLARKMAPSPEAVLEFLRDLARRSRPAALEEFAELEQFAHGQSGLTSLESWDIAYWSQRLREHRYEFSQESLRPYFPLPRVLAGLFEVTRRLYGIGARERSGVETWHDDVRFFELVDEGGAVRGAFYLDLYARPHKRGGAWMDECRSRRGSGSGVQTPVAYLTCNFSPPAAGAPALLTHDEVMTLFHEFGHGLHHMLTTVEHPAVAGINGVPWDAVELPSQFMENWCWERESLDLAAAHHATGERLPDALFQKMHRARHFQAGMAMVRQVEFALFDFRLHHEARWQTVDDILALRDEVRDEVAVVKPPPFARFAHSFSHIFSGGYGAGYYSYKWAEVLSADAFSRFEETGIFDRDTGRRFLHSILEQGGTRDPMDMFIEFRGRPPSIEALLRHSGIALDTTGPAP